MTDHQRQQRAYQDETFLPHKSFQGAKAGYVFKLGEEGLGYYRDSTTPTKQPFSREAGLVAPTPPAFIACDSFEGAKHGYVFQVGANGVGYYRDARQGLSAPTAPAASSAPEPSTSTARKAPLLGTRGKPVMIKSNRSIVKVPIIPNDAKRRKVGTSLHTCCGWKIKCFAHCDNQLELGIPPGYLCHVSDAVAQAYPRNDNLLSGRVHVAGT
jgi:hypothetical protein